MTEQFILKQRLQELIGNAKVKAALFYTFNFDPKFFENYVMPLLVPEQQFINNSIANNIIWRKLYKDGKVPPITVYCDQYAKFLEAGPMLYYKIVEVNMPSIGKNKGNFHSKQSFILIENEGVQSLIMVTGSNNITQGGWCENKECISELILLNTGFFPYDFKTKIKNFVLNVNVSYRKGYYSAAENEIDSYLNKQEKPSNKKIFFYDSFQMCFQDFLEEQIFYNDKIKQVEIVSPYFKNDTVLVSYFQEKGIAVKIEAPMRNNYCLLEADLYNSYFNAGVRWYYPSLNKDDSKERNVHSKVYRFYSTDYIYTFLGSVNFTAPAWCGFQIKIKEPYNIESGVLYIEKSGNKEYLLKNEIKDPLSFLAVPETDENYFERQNAPSILFTINWIDRTISWKAKLENQCELLLSGVTPISLNRDKSVNIDLLPHGKEVLQSLSRRSILEVKEYVKDEVRTYHYFPNQEGFEQKPIEYRLSATDILDAWDLLGEEDEAAKEWLIARLEQLTALAQDESGRIVQEVSEHKSLLNEMARHLYGLIQLEKYLFNEAVYKTDKQANAHGKNLKYFLTHDNVDTLISYIKDIEKLYNEEKLLGGYYWLLLSIIQTNIYLYPFLKKFIKVCIPEKERKPFQIELEKIVDEIEEKLKAVGSTLGVEKKKLNWALESINPHANN